MSQNKRPAKLNLFPTVVEADDEGFHDPRQDTAQFVTDEQGNKMVLAGGKLYPVAKPSNEVGEIIGLPLLDKIGEALIERDIHSGQLDHAARAVSRNQFDVENSDAIFGGIRSGVAKWRYDVEVYRPQRKEARTASAEVRDGLRATQNALVATLLEAHAAQTTYVLTAPTDEAIYTRERGRYERESIFEADLAQKPTDTANLQEQTMARMAGNLQLDLARVEGETRAAERADAAQEAAKDRELEVQRIVAGLNKDLTDAMAELRLIEQQEPGARLEVAMTTLHNAMDTLAVWGASLDKETQQRMGPTVMQIVTKAIVDAQRAVRRG